MDSDSPILDVRDLLLTRGDMLIQSDVSFSVQRGEIFAICGKSGCGKSTLLRALIGLLPVSRGSIHYSGQSFLDSHGAQRRALLRHFGVLFQGGALWSSLTLAENIALPLRCFSQLSSAERRAIASEKLAMVDLAGLEDRYPASLSGGMRKRAGLARALALDPPILFADEPQAGLDPITSRMMDELFLALRDSIRITIIMVTHELDSLFRTADRLLFLDAESRKPIATGSPRQLGDHPDHPEIRRFLQR